MPRIALALTIAVAGTAASWLVTRALDLPFAPAIGLCMASALLVVRQQIWVASTALFPALRPFLLPLTDLGTSLATVLIAPICIVVFIVGGSAVAVQLAVGAGAAVVIALVVTISWQATQSRLLLVYLLDAARSFWNSHPEARVRAGLVLLAGAIALLLATIVWAWVAHSRLDNRGGVPALLFGSAVVVWLIALVFRLAGHFRRPVRGLAVLALILLIAGLLSGAGVLPSFYDPKELFGLGWRTWVILVAAFVLVSMLVEGAVTRWLGTAATGGWRGFLVSLVKPLQWRRAWLVADIASMIGWSLAMAAAALVVASVVAAQFEQRSAGKRVESSVSHPQSPDLDLAAVRGDARLARLFAPVFAFTAGERWSPISVDDFLRDQAVLIGAKRTRKVSLRTLPRQCRPRRRSCFTLTCRPADSCAEGAKHSPGRFVEGAVYARIVRYTPKNARIFAVTSPYAGRLLALIQYWIFYSYDEWTAPVLVGRIRQSHEGDWEAVTVGLGKTPLFVAYSAHCAGRWADWGQIEAETAKSGPSDWDVGRAETPELAIHPLVAVAQGSHANYVRISDKRPSDWSSCRNIPDEAVAALSYASNIRDITGDAWKVYPKDVPVVSEKDPPMTFPGRWGAIDLTTLESASIRTLHAGSGPETPSLQALWRAPLKTIFHDRRWHRIKTR